MYIISVINYKGGVGKTTITANLGAELARRGHRILLLDLDPQANLTFSFMSVEEWQREYAMKTLKSWLDAFVSNKEMGLDEIILTPERVNNALKSAEKEQRGQLDLISSHLELINIDIELAAELMGTSLKDSQRKYLRVYSRLAECLHKLKHDIVLIDCPPNFNIVTKMGIAASDHLLVPAKPDYLSTVGIQYLLRNINRFKEEYNDYIRFSEQPEKQEITPLILGVIFNMVQIYADKPTMVLREYIEQTKKLNIPVFNNTIREQKTIFADAPKSGIPAILSSNSQQNTTIAELKAFVSEFERKLGINTQYE